MKIEKKQTSKLNFVIFKEIADVFKILQLYIIIHKYLLDIQNRSLHTYTYNK